MGTKRILITCYNYLSLLEFKKGFFLFLQIVFLTKITCAQTVSPIKYLVVFENKNDVNFLPKNSLVNPNNYMNIKNVYSMSQLYPIVTFEDSLSPKINSIFQVEGNLRNNNLSSGSATFSFMELYGQLSTSGQHYFTFGKKRLDWGSGLIWNPTVFYTQKNPLRVQNRIEGIYMLNYSYVSEHSTLGVYVFPDSTSKESKIALKYDFTGNRIDGSVSYIHSGNNNYQIGYSVSYGGDRFTLYSEGVIRNFTKSYGISRDGLLLEPGQIKKRIIPEIVFGSSVTLNPLISYFFEYRYKNDNLNRNEIDIYKAEPVKNSLLFDPISIGRHTIFNSIDYKNADGRWSLSLRNFYDIVSKQLILSPIYVYKIKDFQIELSTTLYNNSMPIFRSQSTLLLSFTF